MKLGLSLVGTLLLVGCTVAGAPSVASLSPATAISASRTLAATVIAPADVPAALVASVLPAARTAADDASRRRGIDFFALHDNPIGLQLRAGSETAHVLSFLGTSKERNTLNVELRALVGTGRPGFIMNYTGPVTQGRAAASQPVQTMGGRSGGLQFELLTGLPGAGVTDAYGEYLDHWGERLRQRFSARPFAFDDTPLVLALTRDGAAAAFVFCNQGSTLQLGERKYADVQAVTALGPDGRMLGGYTLVGWNAKTPNAATAPRYELEADSRFGTLAQFGELP